MPQDVTQNFMSKVKEMGLFTKPEVEQLAQEAAQSGAQQAAPVVAQAAAQAAVAQATSPENVSKKKNNYKQAVLGAISKQGQGNGQ